MNKWLFRAVGTVGVASGIWLLGGTAAHAQEAPATDPQALRGLLDEFFTPTGGNLGLQLDVPGATTQAGLLADGPLKLSPTDGRDGFTVSRAEFLPALDGLAGGLTGEGGVTGLLGGLTGGGGSPLDLVGGLTGGLTGGGADKGGLLGGLGGITGGLTGGGADKGGLLGGLTGGDKGGLLGGLTTGGLLGGITGGDAQPSPVQDPQVAGLTNTAPGTMAPGASQPVVTTAAGQPNTDPLISAQMNKMAADMVPAMIAQAMSKAAAGHDNPTAIDPSLMADPSAMFDDQAGLGDDTDLALGDDFDALGSDQTDLQTAFADNPNVAINWVGQAAEPDATAPMAAQDAQDAQAPMALDPATLQQLQAMQMQAQMQQAQAPMQQAAQFAPQAGVGLAASATGQPEGLPIVDGLPLVGPLLGDQGLGKLIVVGNVANKLPVVGSLINNGGLPDINTLPVVGKLLNNGLLSNGQPGGLPIVGSLPVVGDMVGGLTGGPSGLLGGLTGGTGGNALGGLTSGLTGSLTGGLLGGGGKAGALGGLTGGLGGLTGGLGGLAPAAAPAGFLGATPGQAFTALPAPGMMLGAPALARTDAPLDHVAAHAATDRPVAGDEAGYGTESAQVEAGGLPVIGSLPTLSLSRTIAQLPLVGDLPLVGQVAVPLAMLRGLPIVGMVAGILPIE